MGQLSRAAAPLSWARRLAWRRPHKVERGEQVKRYREALPNLILTDYLEFRWYVEGELRRPAGRPLDSSRRRDRRTRSKASGEGGPQVHPNVFLRTSWWMELRPEVFVAMTFSDDHQPRFEQVIAPAIRAVPWEGGTLEPKRVDERRSGDCILTEIMDGIAHSQLVLADVSTLLKDPDPESERVYRNGNVMYEVGVALACRQPSEVLLIREDRDDFLFDVSTIPHVVVNFDNVDHARDSITEHLVDRLKERKLVHDARVNMAVRSLSSPELSTLRGLLKVQASGWATSDKLDLYQMVAITRLLDKQLIRVMGQTEEGRPVYTYTELGRVVAEKVATELRMSRGMPGKPTVIDRID